MHLRRRRMWWNDISRQLSLPGRCAVCSRPPRRPHPSGSVPHCASRSCTADRSCTEKHFSRWCLLEAIYLVNSDGHTDPVLPHQHCIAIKPLTVLGHESEIFWTNYNSYDINGNMGYMSLYCLIKRKYWALWLSKVTIKFFTFWQHAFTSYFVGFHRTAFGKRGRWTTILTQGHWMELGINR